MQTCAVLNASPCVDDETLFELAAGKLSGAALATVEAHLKDCGDCRAVLAEAARSLEPREPVGEVLEGAVPGTIARYRIEALLGAGASGVVYRAFDPQLKRAVAVKLLRPELHEAGSSERLLREAQSMARLSDPHAVSIYDVGLHEGSVYLVMEYIDGVTLSQWLASQPRTPGEILSVFNDAGRGLAAAHQKGLVHRDFKPENVLVAHDGRAKVTDFGLARESEGWVSDAIADDAASTELYAPTRGLVGTPAYMAPELFEGGPASPASDQFAFATALFTALFHKHPFKAGEGIALGELVTRVRAGTLERPTFDNGLSQRLFAVLARGLAPTPSSRYHDLPELLAALDRARRGRPHVAQVGLVALAALLSALVVARYKTSPAPTSTPDPQRSAVPPSVAPSPPPEHSAPVQSVVSAPAVSSVSPPMPSASPNIPRHRPKPGNVRYKDWLKEPF